MFDSTFIKVYTSEWPAIFIALAGFILSTVFWLRPFGNIKANRSLSLLLWIFSLSLTRDVLAMSNVFVDHPQWFFFPIWFTWALGPLYFFFAKFTLYPAYQWHYTDFKHAFFPVLQVALYALLFFIQYQPNSWFYTQVYKTLEGGFFVLSFLMYLAMSWRYIRFREAVLNKTPHYPWQMAKVRWLKHLTLVFFFLAAFNSFFLILDFSMFKLWGRSLRSWSIYPYLTHYSFALMALWTTYIAWQLLRRTYMRTLIRNMEHCSLQELFSQHGCLFDPDFRVKLLPKSLRPTTKHLFAERQMLEKMRHQALRKQLKKLPQPLPSHQLHKLVFETGFYSIRRYLKTS